MPGSEAVSEPEWPLSEIRVRDANNASNRSLIREVPPRPRLGLLRHGLEHARQSGVWPATHEWMRAARYSVAFGSGQQPTRPLKAREAVRKS